MKLGITMLIHNKDDIEFVTEFPCFLGHPVHCTLENLYLIILYLSSFSQKAEKRFYYLFVKICFRSNLIGLKLSCYLLVNYQSWCPHYKNTSKLEILDLISPDRINQTISNSKSFQVNFLSFIFRKYFVFLITDNIS